MSGGAVRHLRRQAFETRGAWKLRRWENGPKRAITRHLSLDELLSVSRKLANLFYINSHATVLSRFYREGGFCIYSFGLF